jgi:hypothetical protein
VEILYQIEAAAFHLTAALCGVKVYTHTSRNLPFLQVAYSFQAQSAQQTPAAHLSAGCWGHQQAAAGSCQHAAGCQAVSGCVSAEGLQQLPRRGLDTPIAA